MEIIYISRSNATKLENAATRKKFLLLKITAAQCFGGVFSAGKGLDNGRLVEKNGNFSAENKTFHSRK